MQKNCFYASELHERGASLIFIGHLSCRIVYLKETEWILFTCRWRGVIERLKLKMMPFIRLRNHRFLCTLIDFGSQMKKFNDNGQFVKSIELFENQLSKKRKKITTLVVNQFVRACIELKDFKRGQNLHENLSPDLANNHFVATNLIRLYRKLLE